MSTFQSQLGLNTPTDNPTQRDGGSATVAAAQAGAAQGVEFQMWVAQQASSLAKLKIFNTMAKNVNDQQ